MPRRGAQQAPPSHGPAGGARWGPGPAPPTQVEAQEGRGGHVPEEHDLHPGVLVLDLGDVEEHKLSRRREEKSATGPAGTRPRRAAAAAPGSPGALAQLPRRVVVHRHHLHRALEDDVALAEVLQRPPHGEAALHRHGAAAAGRAGGAAPCARAGPGGTAQRPLPRRVWGRPAPGPASPLSARAAAGGTAHGCRERGRAGPQALPRARPPPAPPAPPAGRAAAGGGEQGPAG